MDPSEQEKKGVDEGDEEKSTSELDTSGQAQARRHPVPSSPPRTPPTPPPDSNSAHLAHPESSANVENRLPLETSLHPDTSTASLTIDTRPTEEGLRSQLRTLRITNMDELYDHSDEEDDRRSVSLRGH